MVRRCRPSTISNVFYSETAWPIKAKFYVKPPREGGTKVYINGPGHMTKMAAMSKYGKNFENLHQNRKSMILKLGMKHRGLKLYKVYINNDPGLTLTYGRVKFGNLGFSIGNSENSGFFRNYCSQ